LRKSRGERDLADTTLDTFKEIKGKRPRDGRKKERVFSFTDPHIPGRKRRQGKQGVVELSLVFKASNRDLLTVERKKL